jgi:hypothetical protein
MYAAVPRMTPAAVACAVSVGEFIATPIPDRRRERLRKTEVEHLHAPVVADLDVRGL